MRSLVSCVLLATTVLCRNDYVEDSKLDRKYVIKYDAETWEDAKSVCTNDGGKLAVPKSQDEFNVIQGLVRKMHYPSVKGYTGQRFVTWLGISSTEDYNVWRNVDGEDIEDTGYATWVSGNGGKSSNPKEPHCVVTDSTNPGLRSYWCHYKLAFICEYKLHPNK